VFPGTNGKSQLKGHEFMKMRWLLLTLMIVALSAVAQAQVPDGGISLKGSLNSQAITSLSGPLTFTPCPGVPPDTETITDCAAFGASTQAIFAGQNETSKAWNVLDLVFLGYDPATDPVLNCFGNGVFANCTIVPGADCTPTSTSCSLDVDFSQGSGTGVGCTVGINGCALGSAAAILNNLNPHNPIMPYDWFCPPLYSGTPIPPPVAGAVCGSPHFTVGIGGSDMLNFNTPLSLTASYVADPTPEPQTLLLVGIAILGMAFLASKKGLLAPSASL
jgi:hypothetical protein